MPLETKSIIRLQNTCFWSWALHQLGETDFSNSCPFQIYRGVTTTHPSVERKILHCIIDHYFNIQNYLYWYLSLMWWKCLTKPFKRNILGLFAKINFHLSLLFFTVRRLQLKLMGTTHKSLSTHCFKSMVTRHNQYACEHFSLKKKKTC